MGKKGEKGAPFVVKLSTEKVSKIKAALARGEKGFALSKEYEVDPSTIYKIRKGLIWRDVK
jgi:hypothetical protein